MIREKQQQEYLERLKINAEESDKRQKSREENDKKGDDDNGFSLMKGNAASNSYRPARKRPNKGGGKYINCIH
jgi:hypothetical protein